MTAEEFIAALRVVVRDAAVKDSLATIEHPPGRKPSMELQKASAWYRSLDKDQQAILASVIGEAVDSAISASYVCSMACEPSKMENERGALSFTTSGSALSG
jgi:hypothetical protein